MTVGTSTYGSVLAESRIATELMLVVRYILRSLREALDGPELILGHNMSAVLNTTIPPSVFKKKHNAIVCQLVREDIAAITKSFS
jgi:hypothetical protein